MTRESRSWEGRIESLTQEGLGVGTVLAQENGKHLRRPIFVPFSVPGDTVLVDLNDQKRKYLFGEISAVLKPSPARVQPRCPHFAVCGGCNLQHVSYDEQLKQKAKQISFLLQRKGLALPKEVVVLPSAERECYRWRSRIAVAFTGLKVAAGFRKRESNEIVPVEQCFIVHARILELIRLMGARTSGLKGIEVEVTAIVGSKEKVGILIPLDDIPLAGRQGVREFFEDVYATHRELIGNVFFSEGGKTRSYGQVQEHFTYEIGDLTFSFLPETFIQANISTNPLLARTVVEFLCRDGAPKSVLDLYAGIGNLTLPIAKRAGKVLGVEGSESSVLQGTANALRNGIANATFFHHGVEPYLREYGRRLARKDFTPAYPVADAIVLDPPRTGLTPGMVKELRAIRAPRVVYVSCNPVSLADDLAQLGYVIEDVVGIDMFPDVSHVETVALLRLP